MVIRMFSAAVRGAVLLAFFSLDPWGSLFAQVSIVANNPAINQVALGQTYVQDFDSLPASGSVPWSNNSTLRGWYANFTLGQVSTGNMVATSPSSISAVAVGAAGGAATLNSLGSSGSSDRALGGTPSAYTTGSSGIFSSKSVNAVLRVKNSTGGALTGMKVSYDTEGTSTSNKDAVSLAYRVFTAGSGTIDSWFLETHRYLNTYNGTYDESMRTEFGRRVSSTAGWVCVVKDIAPQTTSSRINSFSFNLRDLALNPGDEIWLVWHISKEDEQGTSDPITTTGIDNVKLTDFTVGRPGLPVIATHPRPLSIATGLNRDATLSVVAKGSGLSYQWRKDGVNIAGATAATYVLTDVTSAAKGTYDVVVSNSSGAVTSLPAKVNTYAKKTVTSESDVSFSAYSTGNSELKAASGGTLCDLYYPSSLTNTSTRVPAMIVIHGGGGNNGDKIDSREVEAAQELAARGWFVIAINYAMSSSTVQCWPYNLWDAKQAVRWLKHRGATGTSIYSRIDTNKIGVLGFSWGCNMGSMLAMTGPADDIGVSSSSLKVEPPLRGDSYDNYSTEVQCSAVFYGAADLPNYHQMNQFLDSTAWNNRTLYRRASPIRYPNPNAAPMFMVHGTADDDVWASQTESTYMMQRSVGARQESYLYVPGGEHSFGLYETTKVATGFPNPIDVRPETLGFFEKYLVESTERPTILAEPVSKIANSGASVTFSVQAVGSPAPSYQWRKDGTAISGATSETYVVTAGSGTAGFYDVLVSNSSGNLTSTAALLTSVGSGVNAAPVPVADTAKTSYQVAVEIPVLGNDTDANNDTLTVTAVGPSANGTTSHNGTVVAFTPASGFIGTATFTYTVSDGNNGTATGNVTVTVANQAPIANSDLAVTILNTPVSVQVFANDSDTDGGTLSLTAVTQGANGSVTFSGSTVTYNPNNGYSGDDSFTYTISDGQTGTATGTVNVSVKSGATTPVTVAFAATIESGTGAGTDINEATQGYVSTKYSATGTRRKAYFQFDLSSLSVDATGTASFTVNFANSFLQNVQLWALDQEYPGFSSGITWNGAQANDTGSNDLLTTGSATAIKIGTPVVVPSSYPNGHSFSIPNIGNYIKGGKVVLVLTGVDAANNNSSGARYHPSNSVLTTPVLGTGNLAPQISDILNTSPWEDNIVVRNFTINDLETPVENLTLSATSSNPTKIPVENIVFGGSGANRTVTVTPAANAVGPVTITIEVKDAGAATSQDSFTFTMQQVNDPPLISTIANFLIPQGAAPTPAAFTLQDPDTDPTLITVIPDVADLTLISSVTVGGSGANRTITPVPVAGKTGQTTVNVSVDDGEGGITITDFQVSVLAVSNFDSAFPGQTPTSDVDNDGVVALFEYALAGSDPANDLTKLPQAAQQGETLALTVVERIDDAKVTIVPEASADLGGWSGTGILRTVSNIQADVPQGFQRVTYSLTTPNASRMFMRLKATLLP